MRIRTALAFLGPLALSTAHAQTFDLDQFDQLFRPRLRVDARWTPPIGLRDAPGSFEDRSVLAGLTFPIHSKWTVGVQADLGAKTFKELLQNSVRVRASQLMGTVRVGTRQVIANDLLGDTRSLHTASIGVLGVSLTRRLHVLFWSVNMNVSEEDRTLDRTVPRFNGVIGKLHVKGLRRNYFYGLTASVTDGLVLPVPFFGGQAPVGGDWSFQYVLPLQVSMVWKPNGRTRMQGGLGLDGSRSGIELGDTRYNLSVAGIRLFVGARRKLNDHWQLRAEVDYLPRQRLLIGTRGEDNIVPATSLSPGLAFSVGVNVLFGQSMLERIMDEVVR